MRGFFILIRVLYIDFAFTNLFLPANCTNLPLLQSHMNNLEKNKNEDALKLAWSDVKQKLDKIFEGGGAKAAAKQKEKNKLRKINGEAIKPFSLDSNMFQNLREGNDIIDEKRIINLTNSNSFNHID